MVEAATRTNILKNEAKAFSNGFFHLTRFIFLILPDVHLLDLAGPDQVISESIDFGAPFTLEYCGLETNTQTSAGLGIGALQHFSDVKLQPGDYLIIPGSRVKYIQSAVFRQNKVLFEWLRQAQAAQVNLVSICVGAFVLAEAGLLDGSSCTTHFQLTKTLQERFPRALVRENVLFVEEPRLFTSAGIASGIDLMLHILEKITDSHFAYKVARELVVYMRRGGNSEQESAHFMHRNHIHKGIHEVQDFIIQNIGKKHYLGTLAEIAHMSERNFTRLFKKETGITVNVYINAIRMETLKILLQNPDLSKKQMANSLGLDSEKQLYRLMASIA
jgi:transcriptional regulator GlxA family with amidase domain